MRKGLSFKSPIELIILLRYSMSYLQENKDLGWRNQLDCFMVFYQCQNHPRQMYLVLN